MAPDAATAGTPTPGKTESPHRKSFGMGVNTPGCGMFGNGKTSNKLPPACKAGPYVPLWRRKNRWCV